MEIGGCDKKCGSTAVVGCDGVCGSGRRRGLGWGDPHYLLLNGLMVDCFESGRRMFARGCVANNSCWEVDVRQVPLAGRWNAVSSIDQVYISVFGPVHTDFITLGPSAWAAQTYHAAQPDEIVVTPTSVAIASMDLHLVITGSGNNMMLDICSGVISDGAVVNGCNGSNAVAPEDPACAALPEPFRSACNIDMHETSDSRFALAALNASLACRLLACGCDDDLSCRDCRGVPRGGARMMACGCEDDKSCRDCGGVAYGSNDSCVDSVGVRFGGDGRFFDCLGKKYGAAVVGCDGVCGSVHQGRGAAVCLGQCMRRVPA
jgi:hypothetical protein